MEFKRGRYHRSYGERNSREADVLEVMIRKFRASRRLRVYEKEIQEEPIY
jgi:hypothetical protein